METQTFVSFSKSGGLLSGTIERQPRKRIIRLEPLIQPSALLFYLKGYPLSPESFCREGWKELTPPLSLPNPSLMSCPDGRFWGE